MQILHELPSARTHPVTSITQPGNVVLRWLHSKEEAFSSFVCVTAWPDVFDEQNLDVPVFLWLEDGAIDPDAKAKPAILPVELADTGMGADLLEFRDLLKGRDHLSLAIAGHPPANQIARHFTEGVAQMGIEGFEVAGFRKSAKVSWRTEQSSDAAQSSNAALRESRFGRGSALPS